MAVNNTVMHNYQFGVGFLKNMLEGIDSDKLTHQPNPGMNHPIWIVGHLVDTMGFAAGLCGGSYKSPDGWAELFGMKSVPIDDVSKYPDAATLLAELDKAVEVIAPALAAIEADTLATEMPDEGFRQMMPTVGDGLTFLLNGHIMMHIGQLSAWRRACGMPPMF